MCRRRERSALLLVLNYKKVQEPSGSWFLSVGTVSAGLYFVSCRVV
jgi:hypothetical protein